MILAQLSRLMDVRLLLLERVNFGIFGVRDGLFKEKLRCTILHIRIPVAGYPFHFYFTTVRNG